MKITVKVAGQKYEVEVEDIHARPVVAIIEGERFEVWPEVETTSGLPSPVQPTISVPEPEPFTPANRPPVGSSGGKDLTAPLPGVIVAILVREGEAVLRGQELCTLEAMKMKNAIKSHRDGKVDVIAVNVGDQVNHGQVLMTFME